MKVVSSHDVIAANVLAAMQRDNKSLNATRQPKQLQVTETLLTALDQCAGDENRAALAFGAFQRFTQDYVGCFGDTKVQLAVW